MARNRSTRAYGARALALPAALALAALAALALTLAGGHRDARHDLEARFADRASSTAAMVHALLESHAASRTGELNDRFGPDGPSRSELEDSVRASQSVYALVAGPDGRVLASTRRAPAAAAARAGEAMDRLGFPGAPAYLLGATSDEGGRALVEIAITFRAGKQKRVHLSAIPARIWASFFDSTLERALRPEGTRALVLDDRDRLLGDSDGTRHPGAPYGRSAIASTGGATPVTASARIGNSPLRVVYAISKERLYTPIGGRRAWASWVALGLAALAMAFGLWLMTRLRASHAALRLSEERYALAVRAANDALWDWDLVSDRVHYSERWAEMLGEPAPPSGDANGWLDRVHPEDRLALDAAIAAHLAGDTPHLDCEHRLRHAGGDWMWVLVRGLAVRDAAGRPTRLAGSLSDVTARRRAMDHLEHQATHDPLTGLANRAYFFSVLERAIDRARRDDQSPCAVIYLDLDGFKQVNDRLGHVFGDAVLATVGSRLQRSVRPGDVVGRLGGDELAVLLTHVADAGEAYAAAERLSQMLAEPYEVLGERIRVGASAGVAVAEPSDDAESLLREADAAMYRAKLAV